MRHRTPAEKSFKKYRRPTRREQFLDEMDRVIPWRELCKVIKPFYPKPKGAGPDAGRLVWSECCAFSETMVVEIIGTTECFLRLVRCLPGVYPLFPVAGKCGGLFSAGHDFLVWLWTAESIFRLWGEMIDADSRALTAERHTFQTALPGSNPLLKHQVPL